MAATNNNFTAWFEELFALIQSTVSVIVPVVLFVLPALFALSETTTIRPSDLFHTFLNI